MIDSFLKSSLEMRDALRTTSEPHLFAKIVSPFPANCTLTARNANFESDSVANCEAINLRSNAHNYTGRFMAKRKRCTSTKVTICELLVIADV